MKGKKKQETEQRKTLRDATEEMRGRVTLGREERGILAGDLKAAFESL